MDESRYSRLETRVDEIKDDVAEVKAEQKVANVTHVEMRDSIKELTRVMTIHVAGDDKIITEIHPIIEEFKYQQERRKRRRDSLKGWGLKLGIPATVLGIVATALKVWSSV